MDLGALTDRGTSDAYSRRFGLPADYTLSLGGEVMPVAPPSDYPEILYHQGWRRWQIGGQAAAGGAGTFGELQLVNRSTSGLAIVERVLLGNSAAAGTFVSDFGYSASAALGTIAQADFRDGRQIPSAGTGLLEVSFGTVGAALVAVGGRMLSLAGVMVEWPGAPWVLVPGNTLLFCFLTANAAVDFTVVWRERRLQDQENVP